jgi:hypothetical protein
MKNKNLFLSGILLLSIGCSNNVYLSEDNNAANMEVNEQETTTLPSCELKTTFLGEFEATVS